MTSAGPVVSVSAALDEGTAVERFNDYFATEAEARLFHRIWALAQYAWKGADVTWSRPIEWCKSTSSC